MMMVICACFLTINGNGLCVLMCKQTTINKIGDWREGVICVAQERRHGQRSTKRSLTVSTPPAGRVRSSPIIPRSLSTPSPHRQPQRAHIRAHYPPQHPHKLISTFSPPHFSKLPQLHCIFYHRIPQHLTRRVYTTSTSSPPSSYSLLYQLQFALSAP